MQKVIIKDIPGFPGYKIDNLGNVYSYIKSGKLIGRQITDKAQRILKPTKSESIYRSVTLYDSGQKHEMKSIHRLLLMAFNPVDDMESLICRHLDGDRYNNSLENLAWGTHKDNVDDALRHGTFPHGDSNGMSKLSNGKVLFIRKALKLGIKGAALARMFNVVPGVIVHIKKYRTWKHVVLPINWQNT